MFNEYRTKQIICEFYFSITIGFMLLLFEMIYSTLTVFSLQ